VIKINDVNRLASSYVILVACLENVSELSSSPLLALDVLKPRLEIDNHPSGPAYPLPDLPGMFFVKAQEDGWGD